MKKQATAKQQEILLRGQTYDTSNFLLTKNSNFINQRMTSLAKRQAQAKAVKLHYFYKFGLYGVDEILYILGNSTQIGICTTVGRS
ncbi:hypothetical protein PRUPE_1G402800 [Prunus persica]|uniref:Uncharacterized protein n=2 Tax=Prunus TaxID=3754 RepID=A0AAD4ZTQ0_PRUDU|nr:hypothetical protein L3X38_007022 [Prunus dulcis]ONI33056.1 hypothetical protein PRUPE_1G402800 [Prunus persica]